MESYSEFRPTSFDQSGLNLPDRQNWLVCPVSINRDSDALTRSNWEQMIQSLPDESDLDDSESTWERHSFNHWACGWIEIAIVKPGTESARICEQIESRLEDYCVLDESHFSWLEYDEFLESWAQWAHRDFASECQRVFGLSDSAADLLLDGSDECLEFWMQTASEPYSGDSINFSQIERHDEFSRDAIAGLLLKIRNSVPA